MTLVWEVLKSETQDQAFWKTPAPYVIRAKVPGGWFIKTDIGYAGGAFFYPDPEHLWDGSSLP